MPRALTAVVGNHTAGQTPNDDHSPLHPCRVQANLTIPLFLTVPNAASGHSEPVAGWPVVIFQHGLRGNRSQSAAVAAAYASQGFAVAAIDIPLHGITDIASPLYQGPNERTFNLDLVNNANDARGADGIIDGSGTHIINLTSLLTSRENLRQPRSTSCSSRLRCRRSTRRRHGSGHDGATSIRGISLGAIVARWRIARLDTLSAYLNVPGGGIANLLRESGRCRRRSTRDSPRGRSQIRRSTSILPRRTDGGGLRRPINHVAAAFAARPILVTQVCNDTVVPNTATQRLINAAPFIKASAAGPHAVAAGSGRWVHFLSGSHGSLLDPTASLAVTTEMQTHAASLVASGGAAFVITPAGSALLEP